MTSTVDRSTGHELTKKKSLASLLLQFSFEFVMHPPQPSRMYDLLASYFAGDCSLAKCSELLLHAAFQALSNPTASDPRDFIALHVRCSWHTAVSN